MDTSFKGVLFDSHGHFLLGHNPRDEWELLGGRADSNDASPSDTIVREFHEEAGLTIDVLGLIDIWYYDIANEGRVAVASYLVQISGSKLNDIAASEEHSNLEWFGLGDLDYLPMPNGYKTTIRKAAAMAAE